MPLDIEELEPTTRNDYRRANGAPMVLVDGKNERYSRPSSFAKPLDDESALVNWKIDRGCIGVAYDRALQAAYVAVEVDDRETLKELREKAIAAGRGAERADIGTALHAMSVRFEQDMSFSPPQPYLESLQAYMNGMNRLNLATVRSEFHTVNREYRCAGTADRLYEVCTPLVTPTGEILPVGTLIVGDLKTGEKLEYSKPAYAVQLAIYAEGEFYDVLTDEFLATPPINRDWAIIVHMPVEFPGTCEFLWVDLEVGRWGAYLVQQIKLWRKNWRSGEFDMPLVQLSPDYEGEPHDPFPAATCWCGQPDDPAVEHQNNAPCYVLIDDSTTIIDEPVVVSTNAPASIASGDGGLVPSLDGYIEWARERIAQIAEHHAAKQALMRQWPAGLPTPKQGITNMVEADAVLTLLSQIEADFQLSFVPMPASIVGTGPSTRRKGK